VREQESAREREQASKRDRSHGECGVQVRGSFYCLHDRAFITLAFCFVTDQRGVVTVRDRSTWSLFFICLRQVSRMLSAGEECKETIKLLRQSVRDSGVRVREINVVVSLFVTDLTDVVREKNIGNTQICRDRAFVTVEFEFVTDQRGVDTVRDRSTWWCDSSY